ncbi:hypothetical protein DPX16_8667 [Anabarilius grahami]|uniref:Uncharacterized protein n=1 Tax=Anabarilius grahami TaxID=495550 RepID=A0A3N0YAB9_ANAGA|nr:hypothetical protein DPX16_8667 [Anabarilius grahami]
MFDLLLKRFFMRGVQIHLNCEYVSNCSDARSNANVNSVIYNQSAYDQCGEFACMREDVGGRRWRQMTGTLTHRQDGTQGGMDTMETMETEDVGGRRWRQMTGTLTHRQDGTQGGMDTMETMETVCWRHPPNATESEQRNILLEPARAGAQDGSMTDNMVTDPGMDMTTSKNKAHETTTAAAGHSLQVCTCGWVKITSFRGLRTHQGRRGCLREQRQGPRIDQYFLRSKQSSQSIEAQ